uniref:Uncharacterized protein n=1 Tax=Trachelomonas grandis TaxID=215769 RepID=A0A385UK41_9EUGL|nr:hypothetical protein [Trachelomonas grandis]
MTDLVLFMAKNEDSAYIYDLFSSSIRISETPILLDDLLFQFSRLKIYLNKVHFDYKHSVFVAEVSLNDLNSLTTSEILISRDFKILNYFKKLSSSFILNRFQIRILLRVEVNRGLKFNPIRHVNYICVMFFKFKCSF